MLPLRLALHNFMCYRGETPPLELEGLRLACLCGDNGHGKSALLDAMTWALWGRSRANSADDLIHAGETETQVTLDFLAQGARYRVVRRHGRPRSHSRPGQTTLDLLVAMEESFRPISGNSLQETQRAIIDLLRLDYQTFINSAFLLQGRDDLFTTARPAERKRVLGEILALSLYDRLEERAKARRDEAANTQRSLEFILAEVQEDLARREQLRQRLGEVEIRLATGEDHLWQSEARLMALQERQARLALMEEGGAELRDRLTTLAASKRDLEVDKSDAQARLDGYLAVLAQTDEVTQGFEGLQQARRRFQEFASRAAEFVALSTRRAELERLVDQARSALVGDVRILETQAQQARDLAQTAAGLRQERTQLAKELAVLGRAEEDLERTQGQALEAATAAQVLQEANTSLRHQMEELRGKADLLEAGLAICPLCGTAIGEHGLAQVRAHYEREGKELARQYRENQNLLRERERQRQEQRDQVRREEARLRRERSNLEGRLAVVEREIAQAAQAAQQAAGLEERESALHAQLAREEFAQWEQHDLALLREELASLGHDPEEYGLQEHRIQELEPFEPRYHRMEEARAATPRERASLEAAGRRLVQLEQDGTVLADRLAALEGELVGQAALRQETAESQQQVAEQRSLREELAAQVARLRGELERLAQMEAQQAERRLTLKSVTEERDTYTELATAFGKQGVQALLIEAALPEIEEEANSLLARMTEGRMTLRLESQRETRQGRVVETLEVRIADEWGTRPYELYSGGEAFRINLALRIGLSRLLARRSGAPLPVLFIDEGFGTQDAQGRDRVVEAIGAIQDEFDLILVITHIQELKELFPVRIEVEKRGDGSTFTVVA